MLLICSYGAPLAQRATYLALLIGPDGTDSYDYIVTNSIDSVKWLKMHSQWRTQCQTLAFVEPIWPMLQNISKTLCNKYTINIVFYYNNYYYKSDPENKCIISVISR